MSVRQGNKIIASKPTIDNSVTQDSPNAVSGGGVYTALQGKQATLVSGTNIKTINTNSLLGSGDITIDGLPSQTGNSGKLLTTNGTTPSWTAIKTINSGSLVGSGNIDVLVNEATPASSLGVGYTTINTTYADSINIGNGAQVLANNALALGAFASAEGQDSIAIYSSTGTAHRARTTHTGNIAIGYNALAINAAYTIAIGYNAFAQGTNSIQLGTGNIASQNTFQVWTYPMLDKTTGLIPAARLADQTSATQGQVLTLDSNLDAVWADASGVVQSIDAEISGSLTVDSSGAVSGFSSGFLLFPGALNMKYASSFEVVLAFTTPNSVSAGTILDYQNLSYDAPMTIGIKNTKELFFDVYRSGSAVVTLTGATTLQADTKYYVKLVYDGTDYTLSLSTDGSTWTTEATATATYLPEITTKKYKLGTSAISVLYMAECYIKKDGVLIYSGLSTPNVRQRVPVGHQVIAFQEPTALNNYTWYRKYADGWVEQGGVASTATADNTYPITLPVTMSNVNYSIQITSTTGNGFAVIASVYTGTAITTTGFNIRLSHKYNSAGTPTVTYWQVSGIAA